MTTESAANLRPPDDKALRLLGEMLRIEFPGAPEIRGQLVGLRVRAGCTCGCGTLELHPAPTAPLAKTTSGFPVELAVLDSSGAEVGGLILFVSGGLMSSLEIYSYDEPLPLPELSQVRRRP